VPLLLPSKLTLCASLRTPHPPAGRIIDARGPLRWGAKKKRATGFFPVALYQQRFGNYFRVSLP